MVCSQHKIVYICHIIISILLQANLLFFVEKILSAIFASARSCPQMMCRVFSMLRDAAVAKFPGLFGFKQASLVSTHALLVQIRRMWYATLQSVGLYSYDSLPLLF